MRSTRARERHARHGCSATRRGGCRRRWRRSPTRWSACPSTGGPRASTWPPLLPSACTPRPEPSAAVGPVPMVDDMSGQVDPAAVLAAAPDGVVVADATGLVVAFNRAAVRLTGLDPEAVLGRSLSEALPLEDSRGRSWWDCSQPYDGLVTRTGHPEVELTLPGGP